MASASASASLVTSPLACAAYPETAEEPLVLITHNRWRCWFLHGFSPNIPLSLSLSLFDQQAKTLDSVWPCLTTCWKIISNVSVFIFHQNSDFLFFFRERGRSRERSICKLCNYCGKEQRSFLNSKEFEEKFSKITFECFRRIEFFFVIDSKRIYSV